MSGAPTQRIDWLNNQVNWKTDQEILFQNVTIQDNIDINKISASGVQGSPGKILAIQSNGLLGFDDPMTGNEICQHVIQCLTAGISGSGQFTAGHYYELSNESLHKYIGGPVILINNTIYTTTTPNDKKIIGFLGEITSGKDSINNKELNNIGYVIGIGDSYQWKKESEIDLSGNYNTTEVKHINGVNICNEGGNIEIGDFITSSSRPGFFKKQRDDIVKNYTAGKCMQNVTFDKNGQAKNIYCIMMCG